MHDEHSIFLTSKLVHDELCKEKYEVLRPMILSMVPLSRDPRSFSLVGMPGRYGLEKELWTDVLGIPRKIILALEDHPTVHRELSQEGYAMTPTPQKSHSGISYAKKVNPRGFDGAYFDHYGYPGDDAKTLYLRLFGQRVLKSTSTLISTFGMTRCPEEVVEADRRQYRWKEKHPPVLPIIHDMIRMTGHPEPVYEREVPYRSYRGIWYVTVEQKFERRPSEATCIRTHA